MLLDWSDWGQYGDCLKPLGGKTWLFYKETGAISLQQLGETLRFFQDKKDMSNRDQWLYPVSYATKTRKPSKNFILDDDGRRYGNRRALNVIIITRDLLFAYFVLVFLRPNFKTNKQTKLKYLFQGKFSCAIPAPIKWNGGYRTFVVNYTLQCNNYTI